MRSITSLFLFLVICGSSWAADFSIPKQDIEVVGGEPVKIGDLIALRATPVGEKPKDLHAITYTWKVFDLENNDIKENVKVKVVEDEVIFGTGCAGKRILAQVAITYLFVVKDGVTVNEITTKTSLLHKVIQVGEYHPTPPPVPVPPEPNPNPQPNPPAPPGPKPGPPDSKLGLSKFVYDVAKEKVDVQYREKGAAALSKSFASISAKIAAGVLTSEKAILEDSLQSNRRFLDEAHVPNTAWQAWALALEDRLWTLYQQGNLRDVDSYRIAFQEISVGLESIAVRGHFGALISDHE